MISVNSRQIWRISFPILISLLITQFIGITDVVFLGHLDTISLGAAGLGATYYFAFFMIISGFSFGAQIIMSHRNGEQNYHKIGAVFYQCFVFLLVLSFVLVIFSIFCSPYILKLLIKDTNVFLKCVSYLQYRILGLFAASIIVMFRSFFVSLTKTFVLQISSFVMLFSNILLNYALIFGHFGFEPLGIKGAAIASVSSEVCAALVFIFYLIKTTNITKYAFNHFVYHDFKLLASVFKISFWTMLQQFISVSTWFIFFIAVEHLGSTELAVSNILKNSAGIPWTIIVAFGATSSTLTGNLIGEGNSDKVISTNKKVIQINTWTVVLLLVIFSIFCQPILSIYTNDSFLRQQAILPYMTALLCYIPLFSGWIWFQAVSATGNTRYMMLIELVATIFYLLFICFFVFYLRTPLYIAMLSDGVYNLVIFIMAYRFMYHLKWQNKIV